MGLRGIEKDGTEGEGTKADMTDHVKDISCHGPLSLSSSHALLLQTCSASSHSTGPFFNLCTARVFIHTFFQHFFVTLFGIIILKYPCNSQINSLPDVLWHKGLNLSSLLSIVTLIQIPLHVYNFWYSKKTLKARCRIVSCHFLYITCPSPQSVKGLQAASFWHWVQWCVLGRVWVNYVILFIFVLGLVQGSISGQPLTIRHHVFSVGSSFASASRFKWLFLTILYYILYTY